MLGWLRLEGERRGVYGTGLGVALYTMANIAILGALILWSAISLDRSESRRRHVEEERERFFAVTPDLLCIAGFDGYFKSLNPAWQAQLGYTQDQLMARPLLDFVHPDDRAATSGRIAAMSGGTPVVAFENRFRRQDGSYRWFSWNAIPVAAEQLIYATGRDITGQKEAQERLRQSEEHVRSIIDAAHDAFIAIDADGTVCGWNAAAERAFGWSREEAMGGRLSEMIIPARHRAAHEQGIRRFLATGEGPVLNQRIEMTALRRGAEEHEFPIELGIWPVRAGDTHTFNAFVRDITQRKQAEEVQARMAALVEFSDDAIMGKTLDGTITSWNPAAERLFGYTAAEAVGQPMAMLLPSRARGRGRGDPRAHPPRRKAAIRIGARAQEWRADPYRGVHLADPGRRRPDHRRFEGGPRHHRAASRPSRHSRAQRRAAGERDAAAADQPRTRGLLLLGLARPARAAAAHRRLRAHAAGGRRRAAGRRNCAATSTRSATARAAWAC